MGGPSPNWQMYRFRVLQRWSFQLKAAEACSSTQLPNLLGQDVGCSQWWNEIRSLGEA